MDGERVIPEWEVGEGEGWEVVCVVHDGVFEGCLLCGVFGVMVVGFCLCCEVY